MIFANIFLDPLNQLTFYLIFLAYHQRKYKTWNYNLTFNFPNAKKVQWVDIWEVNSKVSSLEKIEGSSWNLYFKYKLSIYNSWHALEDRIAIFFIYFLFLL